MELLDALLSHIVDYAGLFPPAGMAMPAAIAAYASYAEGPTSRWLGRFVVPLARLIEFEQQAALLLPAAADRPPWVLSVLGSVKPEEDSERIVAFNRRHASHRNGSARITCAEYRLADVPQLARLERPRAAVEALYVELPLDDAVPRQLEKLRDAGVWAKVRLGGVTPEVFPGVEAVARFLAGCAQARLPFKATAGLHHALRSCHRTTMEDDSPSAMMHGFVNLALAAALVHAGHATHDRLVELLNEASPEAFDWRSSRVRWRGAEWSLEDIRAARRDFLHGFGSCSFQEPLDELAAMGWSLT